MDEHTKRIERARRAAQEKMWRELDSIQHTLVVLCPGCNGKPINPNDHVKTCGSCNGIYTDASRPFANLEALETETVFVTSWCECRPRPKPEEERYYDLHYVVAGVTRRVHGWYHPACWSQTQEG